jgi:SRSO17 transposase
VEPIAARLCPDNVGPKPSAFHHVVAHAPWRDEDILEAVRQYALCAMQKQGPLEAWVVDDTGFVKKERIRWE